MDAMPDAHCPLSYASNSPTKPIGLSLTDATVRKQQIKALLYSKLNNQSR